MVLINPKFNTQPGQEGEGDVIDNGNQKEQDQN